MPDTSRDLDWGRRLTAEQVLWQYPGRGAHARFAIGDRHSGAYFNSDVVFRKPALLDEMAQWFFEGLAPVRSEVRAVVAKAPYSSRLAMPLASLLGVPLVKFGEEPIAHPRGVLVLADDIYSGGLVGEITRTLESSGIEILDPVCVVVNFSGEDTYKGRPLLSLVKTEKSPAWSPDACPLCHAGSSAVHAREDWNDLVGR